MKRLNDWQDDLEDIGGLSPENYVDERIFWADYDIASFYLADYWDSERRTYGEIASAVVGAMKKYGRKVRFLAVLAAVKDFYEMGDKELKNMVASMPESYWEILRREEGKRVERYAGDWSSRWRDSFAYAEKRMAKKRKI